MRLRTRPPLLTYLLFDRATEYLIATFECTA